jgi:hypothetical protein
MTRVADGRHWIARIAHHEIAILVTLFERLGRKCVEQSVYHPYLLPKSWLIPQF